MHGWQSAQTINERPWVCVSVEPCSLSAPVVFGHSVCVCARALSSQIQYGSV